MFFSDYIEWKYSSNNKHTGEIFFATTTIEGLWDFSFQTDLQVYLGLPEFSLYFYKKEDKIEIV